MSELSVAQARETILAKVAPLGAETVALADARERVLAEDLVAPRNLPPWDNSAMDGYAVLAADLAPGARLAVIEDVPAGKMPAKTVVKGSAIRIMTGAPLPAGADTVIQVELTLADGRDAFRCVAEGRLPAKGDNVRAAGEDVRAGTTVIARGEVMTPAAIGVAASLGRAHVAVHKRPRVAILSTGDEIAEVGTEAGPAQIYNSNGQAMVAAAWRAGALPTFLGIARDTREDLEAKLRPGLACDAIVSSGGVSVGEHDFVKEVLASLGSEMQFWRIAQRPGYPLAFGTIGTRPVFGLPGNPVSTLVSWEQYVQPALLKMAGRRRIFPPVVSATLEEDVRTKAGRTHFVRGVLTRDGEGFRVRSTGGQSSGVLTSMLRGNGLIVVPAERDGARAGERVTVQVIDPGFWLAESPGFK